MRFSVISIAMAGMLNVAAAAPAPETFKEGLYQILDDGTRIYIETFKSTNNSSSDTNALETRQSGTQRGYLWTTNCSGDNWQWNGGSGCYEYWDSTGRRDMYSVYVGGNSQTTVYSDPGCRGSSAGGYGNNLCWHRGGSSIKSFRVLI